MAVSPANGRSQAVQLGADLRELRKRTGRTVVQVAETLGMHHSTISRWERGDTMPDEADTAALLAIYGVTGEERARLVELARQDTIPDWVAPGIGRQLAALIEHERRAERIIEVNPLLIPGLLQTRDYTLALMLSIGTPQGQAEQDAIIRMGRQSVLTSRRPAKYLAVIGEQAVRYPPCDNAVAADQLHHLLMMSERPNIEIRILPIDRRQYSIALEGRFMLFEFPRDNPVVQVESHCSTSTLTNAGAVGSYQKAVGAIRAGALNAVESADLLKTIAHEMETSHD
jgi:transcriptional regulator with XRE-family HTH domain